MAEYHPLCPVGALAPGQARLVTVDGKRIALFRVNGAFHAMEDTCLHAGGPLHEGTLDGTTVTCPWHQWQFDITSGRCALNPMVALTVYEVRVRDGMVEIRVS